MPRTLARIVRMIVLIGCVAAVAVAVGCAGYVWSLQRAPTLEGSRLGPQNYTQIQLGRYLTVVGDCESCHDDQESNEPFAGGRAIETPFGKVLAANITPDRDTGIGAWSDAEFVAALREGRSPHGSFLYPAMPYPYYTKLSEADALAVRAYLNMVKPVRHDVVSNQLPFPFDIRGTMTVWNWLFFNKGEYITDPAKSADWNRGAFLVLGPGHCGACHTPKNFFGSDDGSRALQGDQLQGWFAPNITGDKVNGVGGWSVADIASYLKSGHNPISSATGIMGEEVVFVSSHMSDDDLKAIAIYLKSLPGQSRSTSAVAPSDLTMTAGAAIYTDQCSACHAKDARGVEYLFPALSGSPNVHSDNPTSLIRVVLEGARSVATPSQPTGPGMPPFAWKLSDSEIAAVLTYVRNSWGAAAPAVTPAAVRAARASIVGSATR